MTHRLRRFLVQADFAKLCVNGEGCRHRSAVDKMLQRIMLLLVSSPSAPVGLGAEPAGCSSA